jgi:hypothetical protein
MDPAFCPSEKQIQYRVIGELMCDNDLFIGFLDRSQCMELFQEKTLKGR